MNSVTPRGAGRPMLRMSVALALVAASTVATYAGAATAGSPAAAPVPPEPENSAAAVADNLAKSPAGVLAMHRGPLDTLVRKGVALGGNGLHYVSYERTYKGLPVVGGDAVVVTDAAGAVVNAVRRAGPHDLPVGTTPRSPRPRPRRPPAPGSARSSRPPHRAWWCSPGERPRSPGRPWSRVWPSSTRASCTSSWTRPSGDVVDSYDEVREAVGTGNGFYQGPVTITTAGSGIVVQHDRRHPPGHAVRRPERQPPYTGTDNAWGNGSGTNLETACVDALYDAQKEWDMLASWLGRNGFNGNGGRVPDPGRPGTGERVLERQLRQLRPLAGQPAPGHPDRRGRPRVRARHLPDHRRAARAAATRTAGSTRPPVTSSAR